MVYFTNMLLLLLDITQETVLNWFGLPHPAIQEYQRLIPELIKSGDITSVDQIDYASVKMSPIFSLDTLQLIGQGFFDKLQNGGLGTSDIETLIVCFVIFRFIILTIRYNLETSALITSIAIVSTFIWYSHFIQILVIYENTLYKTSYTYQLGMDSYYLKKEAFAEIRHSGAKIKLTNPIGMLLHAIDNGSIKGDYRIDPLSMFISVLPDRIKNWQSGLIERTYYLFYRKLIPLSIRYIGEFYREVSSIASYTLMVRIGKRSCPYHIRWHYTMMIMSTLFEPYVLGIWNRINKYIAFILIPKLNDTPVLGSVDPLLTLEIQLLELGAIIIAVSHLSFLLYATFQSICGQYFWLPIITENVELHIGPRDERSVYSGGNTPWQAKRRNELLPFSKQQKPKQSFWRKLNPFRLIRSLFRLIQSLFKWLFIKLLLWIRDLL